MNALLLMTSMVAGADAPAAAASAPAACCSDACDPCAKKPGLLDKIKARLHKNDCCEAPKCCEKPAPAPKCCAPAPAPKCEASCDPCARPNLLDKIKSKLHSRKKDCCAPACDSGCGAAPAPTTPPKDVPKPMDKKAGTDAPGISIPTPGALNVPTIPVTPVSGGKLTGANSPY